MNRQRSPQTGTGPLVSVITVVLNGADSLEATLRSVLEQSYPQLELLVLDGGSKDGSVEIIQRYADQLSYWHSRPDTGLYAAMNQGIQLAKGELVSLLNSDDRYCSSNSLAEMVHAYQAQTRPPVIVHGDVLMVDGQGNTQIRKASSSLFRLRWYGMVVNHPTFLVQRAYCLAHPYHQPLGYIADYAFTLRAWFIDRVATCYLPVPLVEYQAGGQSSKVGLWQRLRAGYRARRVAGFSALEAGLSVPLRLLVFAWARLRNLGNTR